MRRYLFRRRVDVYAVSTSGSRHRSARARPEHERRQGNHVSTWIVRLPLAEADPLKQLAAVRERTEALKRSEAALGADTLMQAAEWLPPFLLARSASLAQGPVNTIVTNVPGPQFPLFAVGAPLLGMYPVVPLISGVGLGIALFSYDRAGSAGGSTPITSWCRISGVRLRRGRRLRGPAPRRGDAVHGPADGPRPHAPGSRRGEAGGPCGEEDEATKSKRRKAAPAGSGPAEPAPPLAAAGEPPT